LSFLEPLLYFAEENHSIALETEYAQTIQVKIATNYKHSRKSDK